MDSEDAPRRRPGGRLDPEADRAILEAAKRLVREDGYARLTMDAVAKRAGVARTTLYRRYSDKAELVSAAVATLRDPARRPDTGDARTDLIWHVENLRRNLDMSLTGTLFMEEPHNPQLIAMFRDRMVQPRRDTIRVAIARGIDRGQLRAGLDVERIIDLLMGALFAAVMAGPRPGPEWSQATVDALWPALVAQ